MRGLILSPGLVLVLLMAACGDDGSEDSFSTTVSAADFGVGWSDLSEDGSIVGGFAASSDLGLVTIGFNEPEVGTPAWHSVDGVTWTSVDAFADDVDLFITDVTAAGPGFVAAGNRIPASGADRGEIWTSTDGIVWTEIEDADLPDGPCATLSQLAANDTGVIAVGCDGSGNDAVWFSADGIDWSVETVPPGASFLGAAAGESGFLVTGVPDTVVWSSDGEDWTLVDARTPLPDTAGGGTVGSGGLLLEAGTADGRLVVWESRDQGATWEQLEVNTPESFPAGPFEVHDLASTPHGYLAIGRLGASAASDEAWEADPLGAEGFVLHSSDAESWSAAILVGAPPFTELTSTADALYGTHAGYGTWVWTPPET